jgi:MFS transporter, DHA3 family, macrolide efflux protein
VPLVTRAELFANPNFRLYRTGSTVSAIGNGMHYIAVSWLALEITGGRGLAIAATLVASSLPAIFLAPMIGVMVDRLERRRLAFTLDALNAVVAMILPLLYWTNALQEWHLYVVAFVASTLQTAYWTTSGALIREIVPPTGLFVANSTSRALNQFGMVLGASLAGFIIAASSPAWTLFIDAVTFVISSVCIYALRLEVRPVKPEQRSFGSDFRAGLGYILTNRAIVPFYLVGLILQTTPKALNTLLPIFSEKVLKVGAQGFGLIDAGWAIGSVFGGWFLPNVVTRFSRRPVMLIGVFTLAAFLLLSAAAQNLVWAVLAYVGMGASMSANILFQTEAQERTDLDFQGRVSSVFGIFAGIVSLFVYLGMGALSETATRIGFTLQAGVIVLAGVFAVVFLTSSRAPRAKPEIPVVRSQP